MAIWRRGGRSRSTRGPGLIERLSGARGLALRDLRPAERIAGLPPGIELGIARAEGERTVALALAARDCGDLVGWGRVAAGLESPGNLIGSLETWLVAPAFSVETRQAAAWLSERGTNHHLVSFPSFADASEEPHAVEIFPASMPSVGIPQASSSTLTARLQRVLDGAAALSGVGALRSIESGFVLYLSGRAVLRVRPDGDGLAVSFLAADRREIQVSEGSFARFAVELHEAVVEMARDPRVLDRPTLERDRAALGSVEQLRIRVTARWLPCGADVAEPIDWVGLDEAARPVLGAVRAAVDLASVPGLLSAVLRAQMEREIWVPGSKGTLRLVLITERVEPRVREILGSVGIQVEVASRGEAEERASRFALSSPPEAEGRRRRSRRRRRGRPQRPASDAEDEQSYAREAAFPESSAESPPIEAEVEAEEEAEVEVEVGTRSETGRVPLETREEPSREPTPERVREPLPLNAFPGESDPLPSEGDEAPSGALKSLPPEEESEIEDLDLSERARDSSNLRSHALEQADSAESGEPAEPGGAEFGDPDEAPDGVDLEIEATLEGEPVEEPPVEVQEPPRRRRARAAIVVADDPGSILAAIVLARERRGIVSFVVATQEGLMDYFRTRATDIGDNVDLQLVGFTAQPVPMEVLSTVALYRGRLDWFDHHEWPVEDVERLRDSIGADAIYLAEGAHRPLASVLSVCERRSRFTDKLIDLSGSRLSESDMQKWGRRVVGLLNRLAEHPGECRSEIASILSGKASELPDAPSVFKAEEEWLEAHDPRIVYFGEYQMVVVRAPDGLDGGELARQLRVRTGSRISMVSCVGDDRIEVACNEERRHINVAGLVEGIASRISWAESRPGGDRTGRLWIEDLARHPERAEIVLGEIVRHKSILYA